MGESCQEVWSEATILLRHRRCSWAALRLRDNSHAAVPALIHRAHGEDHIVLRLGHGDLCDATDIHAVLPIRRCSRPPHDLITGSPGRGLPGEAAVVVVAVA